MWNNLSRILLAGVVVLAALAVYLVYDHGRLKNELEETQKRGAGDAQEVAQARERIKRLDEEVARASREKEEALARAQQTHDEMVKSLEKEVKAGAVTITRLADRLTVNIVDKILFPSGEAAVSEEGRQVLERVGKVLEQSKDKTIRIEGHTDNVPIGKHLQDRFPTNWELSTARATTVARFLKEHTQIEPAAFEAVGMSEYHPIADNRSDKGRAQNRRIEIVLYPRVAALAKELPKDTPSPAPSPANGSKAQAGDKPNKP
jgi:chemotaxis protein MotB